MNRTVETTYRYHVIANAKQKEGKRRMKKVGRVEIPQEAFLAVLKSTKDK